MADANQVLTQTHLIQLVGTSKGIKEVLRLMKDLEVAAAANKVKLEVMGATQKNLEKVMGTSAKAAGGFHISLGQLIARAAVTIPIWFAMRAALGAIADQFTIGIQRSIDMSKALAKASTTAFDAVDDFGAFKVQVKEVADAMGRDFGESAVSVVKAFERIVSAGLGVNEALEATKAIVKAAAIAQVDATDIADQFASTFAVLGDTLDKNVPIQERYNLAFAKINALEKDTVVTLPQLAEGFNKVAGTAAKAGLTFDQTMVSLAVLNTAGQKGATGGTLLSTALNKLISNTDELKKNLGLVIPEGQAVFTTFRQVLNLMDDLIKHGETMKAQKVFEEIFGGERGSKGVGALVSKIQLLNDSLDKVDTSGTDGLQKIIKLIDDQNAKQEITISNLDKQIKRFNEIRTQGSEAFIGGIKGSDNLAQSLQNLNDLMDLLLSKFKELQALGSNLPERKPSQFENILKTGQFVTSTFGGTAPGQMGALFDILKFVSSKQAGNILSAPRKVKEAEDRKNLIQAIQQSQANTQQFGPLLPNGELSGNFISPGEQVTIRTKERSIGVAKDEIDLVTQRQKAEEDLRNLIEEEATDLSANLTTHQFTLETEKARKIMQALMNDNVEETFNLITGVVDKEEVLNKLVAARIKIIEAENKELDEIRSKLGGIVKQSIVEGLNFDENLLQNFGNRLKAQIIDSVAEGLTQAFLKSAFAKQAGQTLANITSSLAGSQGATAAGGSNVAGLIGSSAGMAITQGAGAGTGAAGGAFAGIGAALAPWLLPITAAVIAAGVVQSVRDSRKAEKEALRSQGIEVTSGNPVSLQNYATQGPVALLAAALHTDRAAAKRIGENEKHWNKTANWGGAGGLLFSALTNKSSAVKTSIEEFRIASRIDTTNRELQMVNRNLVAMRQELTFILPQSSYLTETRNNSIEDNFSISSRRGFIG